MRIEIELRQGKLCMESDVCGVRITHTDKDKEHTPIAMDKFEARCLLVALQAANTEWHMMHKDDK